MSCTTGSCGGGYSGYGGGYGGYGNCGSGGIGGFNQGTNYLNTLSPVGSPGCCIKELSHDQICLIEDKIKDLIDCGQVAGLGVCILVDGKPCWRAHLGQRSRDCNDLVTPEARWEFGSISEVFHSVALAELMSIGSIRPQDQVNDYIPYSQYQEFDGKRIVELAGRYAQTSFHDYVDWGQSIGCYHLYHLICRTDQFFERDVEEFKRVEPHVAYGFELYPAMLVEVIKAAFPTISELPTDACTELKPHLTNEQYLNVLRNRYGFTSLKQNSHEFLEDPDHVQPLYREHCNAGGCDPCRPCNSCCSKKSNKTAFTHKYLMCHQLHPAWGLSGSLEDLCRALQIHLQEGLPEDFDCDRDTCYPDLSKPYFCAGAFTKIFTSRYGLTQFDCNSNQRLSSVGMLWYNDYICGHRVWWLDAFHQDGTSHAVFLDRKKCLGIAVLSNTLSPIPHALAAYIYAVICFCDCNIAAEEFNRVWNQYYVFINNTRTCDPGRLSAAGLRDNGALYALPGTYCYGAIKLHIKCDAEGNFLIRLGACREVDHKPRWHRLCLISQGVLKAHVQLSDGRVRLISITPAGAMYSKLSMIVTIEGMTREFKWCSYEPINKGFALECCRGAVDHPNSLEEDACSGAPGAMACIESPIKPPQYFYGTKYNSGTTAGQYLFCWACTNKPPTETACEPCSGVPFDDYPVGGALAGLDPAGEYQNLDDCCPLPILTGGYGYGGGPYATAAAVGHAGGKSFGCTSCGGGAYGGPVHGGRKH